MRSTFFSMVRIQVESAKRKIKLPRGIVPPAFSLSMIDDSEDGV